VNAEEFKTKSINVLKGNARELDHMEAVITAAAKKKADIPNLKDILKELSDTATECRQILDYYDETGPLPDVVRLALVRVQAAVGSCTSALVHHYSRTVRG
jgi:hypothetical protein